MLRINKLTDYAILLLSDLAAFYPQHQSAKTLSSHTGIRLPTVSKLLKILQRQGLVSSYLGVDGGYGLTQPAKEISLARIIEAVEGPIALTECNRGYGFCEQEQNCHVRSHLYKINKAVLSSLQNISLAETRV